jgi:Zn finger protein HypA/HybF involved in hydrogenase expression
MATKCPKGHWYEPETSGGRCPQCATQTQSETSISDDDVLAIINLPIEGGETSHTEHQEGPAKSGSGSAILRRKKICPECSHEASYSFVYCPRCGAPLKLVSTKLGNS